MDELLAAHEATIRPGFFLGVFSLMAIRESLAPRRVLTHSKSARWTNNISQVLLNTVILRIVFPTATVGMASHAAFASHVIMQLRRSNSERT